MFKFINFYGDFVQYKPISLFKYQQQGGNYTIGNKSYFKGQFSHAIKIPFNKGYNEEKLINMLYPLNKATLDKENNIWLIHRGMF